MQDQGKIIHANANRAFDRFVASEAKRGRKATKVSVAGAIRRILKKDGGDVTRQVRILLNQGTKHPDPNFLRAFALATETPYDALFLPSYTGEAISASAYDSYMIELVNTLSQSQKQSILGLIRDEQYHPGTIDLLIQIHAAIRGAVNREQARDEVDSLIRKTFEARARG